MGSTGTYYIYIYGLGFGVQGVGFRVLHRDREGPLGLYRNLYGYIGAVKKDMEATTLYTV